MIHKSALLKQKSRLLVVALFCLNLCSPPAFAVDPWMLKVQFSGLIAFVPDEISGNPPRPFAWALLPDAYYQGVNPLKLPPCVKNEPWTMTDLQQNFPSHEPWIRFYNAKGIDDATGFSLLGTDLQIIPGLPEIAGIDLRAALSTEELALILKERPEAFPDSRVVRSELLQIQPVDFEVNGLGARVRIHGGELLESSSLICKRHYRYSFTRPTAPNNKTPVCQKIPSIPLAEQTVLTAPVPNAAKVTLALMKASGLTTMSLEPLLPAKPLLIQVLNVHKGLPDAYPLADLCEMPDSGHMLSLRWYYQLTSGATNPACTEHMTPCTTNPYFGDARCPQFALGK